MTVKAQRVLRMRHARRAAVAVAAVAAVAALGPAGAFASAGARPDASRAAAGWAPVTYLSAQLSVPGSWLVESRQQLSCGFSQPSGMIFAGIRPRIPKGQGCHLAASVAWMLPAGHVRQPVGRGTPAAVIHGLRVYRLPSGRGSVQYLVPDLGVRVGARGPKARRVLATLTRSPLSVVLGTGPASPVPAGWTWRHFGGVRFAVPRAWTLNHAHRWATCGTGLVPGTLLLIDATRPPVALPCPYQIPTAAADQARPGLTAVTGKFAAKSISEHFSRCRVRHGTRICLSSATGQGGLYGGVLIFSVSRPGQHAATFIVLGLPGPGTGARTIFDSVSMTPR